MGKSFFRDSHLSFMPCYNISTYQPCNVGGMGLDVVHVICRDSCECSHTRPTELPQCHGEWHHPPHTLLYLHPLQSCTDRQMNKVMRRENTTRATTARKETSLKNKNLHILGCFNRTFSQKSTSPIKVSLFVLLFFFFFYLRRFPPAPERRSETGQKQQGCRWNTQGNAHRAYTGPTTRKKNRTLTN